VTIRNNAGTSLAGTTLSIPAGGADEVSFSGQDNAFCQATFSSNAVADRARVVLTIYDSTGEPVTSVRGVRTGGSEGDKVVTPSLHAETDPLICWVVNTSNSTQSVVITQIDDDGNQCGQVSASIGASQAGALAITTDDIACYCEVDASSSTTAKQLRVSLMSKVAGSDSFSAVEGY
jgi:hypothetical protein